MKQQLSQSISRSLRYVNNVLKWADVDAINALGNVESCSGNLRY